MVLVALQSLIFKILCFFVQSIYKYFFFSDHMYIFSYGLLSYFRFVNSNRPGQLTGFDIDYAGLLEMEQCRGVVVASAIFGSCKSF